MYKVSLEFIARPVSKFKKQTNKQTNVVEEHLPVINKTLGSIPSITKKTE